MKDIIKHFVIFIITLEAKFILWKYKPRIIAVTGSVGKTTTKDAIYDVLSQSKFVRKSDKSFNGDIGIPLTVLGCESGWGSIFKWSKNIIEGLSIILFKNKYPDWLILEVGTDHPGEIEKITKWIHPDIVIITSLPNVPVHVEAFNSREDIIKEKLFLAKALKKDGTLILNYDDPKVRELKNDFRSQTVFYGTEEGSEFIANDFGFEYQNNKLIGTRFRVEYPGSSVPVVVKGVVGKQVMYQVLAALAVGNTLGLDMVTLSKVFITHKSPLGRMHLIEGNNNTMIIDDTYNSSPIAMQFALEALNQIRSEGRKIVVLSDMLELGKYAIPEHKKIGALISNKVDMLFVVGVHANLIAESAIKNGLKKNKVFRFAPNQSKEAGEKLASMLQQKDLILVKGSQSMRMERAVKRLMKNPKDAKNLLVRQEREWLKKEQG